MKLSDRMKYDLDDTLCQVKIEAWMKYDNQLNDIVAR